MMKSAVIVDFVRSPFAFAAKGPLKSMRPDDMAADIIKALVSRTGLKGDDVEDLIMGCAFPEGEQGFNIARLVALYADLPQSVAGTTVNRFCGSSMQSIHQAVGAICSGAGEVFICAGVESMSRIPMGGFNPLPNPSLNKFCPAAYLSMGETAENVAIKYNISRNQQEEFAVLSHQKAAAAQKGGKLTKEVIPLMTTHGEVTQDSCIRPDTTLEGLSALKPAFNLQGTVTAGTSSPLTDGASAVLVCSQEYAEKNGLKPLARIKSYAVSGCSPEIMGIGPVGASLKALERANLTVNDIDIFELNEAFASQALACIQDLKIPLEKVNIDGGALALGHPLGATGARITGKAASLLKREGKKFALATQCIGGGQGIATILEAL